MKKIVAILFSLLYAAVISGTSLTVHYCNDEVTSVAIFAEDSNCCCGIEKSEEGCCYEKTIEIQFEEEQIASQNNRILPETFYIELINVDNYVSSVDAITEQAFINYSELPPPKPSDPIYLKNCSLTYYG